MDIVERFQSVGINIVQIYYSDLYVFKSDSDEAMFMLLYGDDLRYMNITNQPTTKCRYIILYTLGERALS